VELVVSFEKTKGDPCPNKEYPLHHFIYNWSASREADPNNSWQENQTFECSSPSCLAILTVNLKPPVLDPHQVGLMTDERLVKARAEEAWNEYPNLHKTRVPPKPINLLNDLRFYIKNGFQGKTRFIDWNSSRFMKTFGVGGLPFSELFQWLGFGYQPNPEIPVSEQHYCHYPS
jgi:ubiquitin carboxyl-terminal hydrolase 25